MYEIILKRDFQYHDRVENINPVYRFISQLLSNYTAFKQQTFFSRLNCKSIYEYVCWILFKIESKGNLKFYKFAEYKKNTFYTLRILLEYPVLPVLRYFRYWSFRKSLSAQIYFTLSAASAGTMKSSTPISHNSNIIGFRCSQ